MSEDRDPPTLDELLAERYPSWTEVFRERHDGVDRPTARRLTPPVDTSEVST